MNMATSMPHMCCTVYSYYHLLILILKTYLYIRHMWCWVYNTFWNTIWLPVSSESDYFTKCTATATEQNAHTIYYEYIWVQFITIAKPPIQKIPRIILSWCFFFFACCCSIFCFFDSNKKQRKEIGFFFFRICWFWTPRKYIYTYILLVLVRA